MTKHEIRKINKEIRDLEIRVILQESEIKMAKSFPELGDPIKEIEERNGYIKEYKLRIEELKAYKEKNK